MGSKLGTGRICPLLVPCRDRGVYIVSIFYSSVCTGGNSLHSTFEIVSSNSNLQKGEEDFIADVSNLKRSCDLCTYTYSVR